MTTRRSFRTRLLVALLTLSALPLLLIAGALAYVSLNPVDTSLDEYINPVALSDHTLARELSRIQLTPGAALAQARLDTNVQNLVISGKFRLGNAKRWPRAAATSLAVMSLLLFVLIIFTGTRLARQYASPLNELVDWTRKIQRREPLPREIPVDTLPELALLQRSLYQLQQGLEKARAAEIDAERLRAFGEVARRVAHEMKNPLTPIRLAVMQLSRRGPPGWHEELEVIAAESGRLEAMARDFAELGRLPEGISAPVDLRELFEDLLRSAVPDGMQSDLHSGVDPLLIDGHYDPLRRAFSNMIRNAVEACHGQGRLVVTLERTDGAISVMISDNGPGVPADNRELIFQPYYTEKGDGTGLGLAIVRQTIEQHHGNISVEDSAGGGATFLIRFPT